MLKKNSPQIKNILVAQKLCSTGKKTEIKYSQELLNHVRYFFKSSCHEWIHYWQKWTWEIETKSNSKTLLVPWWQMFANRILHNCVCMTVCKIYIKSKHTQMHNQNKNYGFKMTFSTSTKISSSILKETWTGNGNRGRKLISYHIKFMQCLVV